MKHVHFKYIGLLLVFLWFAVGGVAHFTATQAFVRIVPPYVPFPLEVVYLTGVIEVVCAVAMWFPGLRQRVGNVLFVFTICVTPANVYMLMNPQLFPDMSQAVLGVRLLGQVVLLACIWWSTREPQPARESSGASAHAA